MMCLALDQSPSFCHVLVAYFGECVQGISTGDSYTVDKRFRLDHVVNVGVWDMIVSHGLHAKHSPLTLPPIFSEFFLQRGKSTKISPIFDLGTSST